MGKSGVKRAGGGASAAKDRNISTDNSQGALDNIDEEEELPPEYTYSAKDSAK